MLVTIAANSCPAWSVYKTTRPRVTGGPKARALRCAGVYDSVGAGVVVVCSVIGPSYGLSRCRGSGLRESSAGAAPLRGARLAPGASTTPDAAPRGDPKKAGV